MLNPQFPDPGNSAGIERLPFPGQQVPMIPTRELLSNAPWIFVVYQGFAYHWTPLNVVLLVLALTPITVLTTRYKRV